MKRRGCFRTAKDKAARLSWLTGRRWSVERQQNGFAVLQDGGEELLFSRLREVEALLPLHWPEVPNAVITARASD